MAKRNRTRSDKSDESKVESVEKQEIADVGDEATRVSTPVDGADVGDAPADPTIDGDGQPVSPFVDDPAVDATEAVMDAAEEAAEEATEEPTIIEHPDATRVNLVATDAEEPDFAPSVPSMDALLEDGFLPSEATTILKLAAGATERNKAKYRAARDNTPLVPGLRLMTRRPKSFWCIGKELSPGVPLDLAIANLSELQMAEIQTKKEAKFINVEEIELYADVD